MPEDLFDFVLESDYQFRASSLKSLENLNLFALRTGSRNKHDWVTIQLKDIANRICAFASFKSGDFFSYSNDYG